MAAIGYTEHRNYNTTVIWPRFTVDACKKYAVCKCQGKYMVGFSGQGNRNEVHVCMLTDVDGGHEYMDVG